MRNIYVIFCSILCLFLISCNNGTVTTNGIVASPTSLIIQNGESALVTVSLNFSGNVSESQTINIISQDAAVSIESIGDSCVLNNTKRSCQFVVNVANYAYDKYVLSILNSGSLPIVTGNSITVSLPNWNYVGESNISNGNTLSRTGVGLVLGMNNDPYIAYVDESANLYVKHYINNQWISLGLIASSIPEYVKPELFSYLMVV